MRPRAAHAYFAIGVAVTLLHLFGSELTAELVRDFMTLTAVIAVLVGIRHHRPRLRLAWYLFALALFTFGLEQLCWTINIMRRNTVAGPIGNTFDLIGYAILMTGAVVALRARTRRDAGGVLDATVLAVASGTVIWEFLMFGKLMAVFHLSVPALAAELIQLLMVMAGLGVLLRLAQTTTGSPASLCYLFVADFGGFVQIVVFTVVSNTTTRVPGSLIESANLLAVLAIAAAALHPAMAQLTEAGPVISDRLSLRRLLLLGTGLVAGPMSVGSWLMLGHPADAVLLVVGSVAIVPLVMYRIRGLVSQREAILAQQALHDSLTGLPNRTLFFDLLSAALRRVRQGASSQVAVVFCDLDGFKRINDSLGHTAGDQLLVAVAGRLQDCVRGNDVVCRFGGDEFLILCENLTEHEIANRISARITGELERPVTLGPVKVTITASIGVAAMTADGDLTAEEIIRDADLAMYAVKQSTSSGPQLAPRQVGGQRNRARAKP